ncbi:MAG: MGH1-like glycoside hydrolase domain-containing protein [Acidimicrobiales bacterium]
MAPSAPGRPVLAAEWQRLEEADNDQVPWRKWGPYLAERAWGTVREDYSAGGDAWSYFPFEQAVSRAYRWNEDGMGGICDEDQSVCLALALWNGKDPILKERPFGLTNSQGNHGEDVKECWWYLDATPTSSWLQWRYHYPQDRFPYEQLKAENARRDRDQPEYELVDTGIFDGDRYFVVTVTWAKAAPEDILWLIEVRNAGPVAAALDVLPTLWFRNRWSWGPGVPRPSVSLGNPATSTGPAPGGSPAIGPAQVLTVVCDGIGRRILAAGEGPGGVVPEALFCDNDTNMGKLWGVPGPRWPKDAISDHVVDGTGAVNPASTGTKAALRYHLALGPGATAQIRLRFCPQASQVPDLGEGFVTVLEQRKAEADGYFDSIVPPNASAEEGRVLRQAAAGMLWCKQFYHYDVARWLKGDPGQPVPPSQRLQGRNSDWAHVSNREVISMPDSWEYPWYASWDLAFHAVALAHLDPAYAKSQLITLGREWYMHPNGQLPAYEWDFGDVNPPVQAWSAMAVWRIDRARRAAQGLPPDNQFLERIFHKMLLNFTWWVNRKDAEGNNIFEGGFLGLDNIGLFDRSRPLPVPGVLEQSDGTAWMAMYCISLLEMALRLADSDPTYEDVAIKFYEHFAYIASAMHSRGLWDADDGFFYDVMRWPDGSSTKVKVCSMVGVVPLLAVTTLHPDLAAKLPEFSRRAEWFERNKPELAAFIAHTRVPGTGDRRLLSVVDEEALVRVLHHVLDPDELLSGYGVRSLSRHHREQPFSLEVGGNHWSVDYEPAESTTGLFGGNSNWRGPVWFPLNFLVIEALYRYARYFDEGLKVEYPAGSGRQATLAEVAADLSKRLVSLFLPGPDGRRPVHGDNAILQDHPGWRDLLWFHEYFNGDTGAGLGASHQTGWTGLVIHLIAGRHAVRDGPGR